MTADRLRQIRERLARIPKVYGVDEDVADEVNTCSAGLPFQIAEDIAALHDDVEWLLELVDDMRLQAKDDAERTR